MRRAQVIVEFAMILPIMLFVILGGAQIGLLILAEMRLEHAVMEGVVAGASEESVPDRCDTALRITEQVYDRPLDDVLCTEPGNLLTVRVHQEVILIVPLFEPTWTISVEESAAIR